MAERPPVPAPKLAAKREQTIQSLIRSFAADQLAVEDFEGRLDLAHRATDEASLDVLVADLPAEGAPTPAPVPAPRPSRPVPANVRERQIIAACLSGVERRGAWTPARKTVAIAVMGGLELDFREASLGPGVTEVQVFACMGGTDIIVPPDLAVDSDGIAILGGWAHGTGGDAPSDPDAPVLRITGVTLMGGVDIKVRLPGESARDTKRRLRAERKIKKLRRRTGDS